MLHRRQQFFARAPVAEAVRASFSENCDRYDRAWRQAAGDLRETYQAPQRSYSRLRDDIKQYGFDLDVPFLIGNVALDVKAGYNYYDRTRKTKDRLFRFDLTSRAPDYVALQLPSQFFDIPNWESGALSVRDFSASAANASRSIRPMVRCVIFKAGY